jgi:uncharacterized membrane protein HdeD (DUF308 family)
MWDQVKLFLMFGCIKVARGSPMATRWSVLLSILLIIAGLLAIALPQMAGVAVDTLIAWLLMFSGVVHVVYAWHTRSAGAVLWEVLVGIAYAGVGLYLLAFPVAGLESLTLALALYLFVEGVMEFILSFQLRPKPGTGWLLFDGIVTLILAAMIWSTWPWSSVWVIGTLVGISMLLSGVTRLMLSLGHRQTA